VSLARYGWSEAWAATWSEPEDSGARPGRVVAQDRGSWEVGTEHGVVRATLPSGATRPEESPAVGDWVALSGERIVTVLPRRSAFVRQAAGNARRKQVLAANVDRAFLMTAAGPDFNVRRLERYLTLAWESGARPVVVVTKVDLAEDPVRLVADASGVAWGASVYPISSVTGAGLDELGRELVPGETVVLLGSSGVGKSTLVNRLAGTERAATQGVREGDDRGRHTTTRRELHVLPDGVLLLDTPGMRELALWASEGSLSKTFPEIDELAGACRFRDCTHRSEPGCAVLAAVESGRLSRERLAAYRKLLKEVAFQERRSDPARAAAYEKSLRPIMKALDRVHHD